MPVAHIITEEDTNEIQQFVAEMTKRANELPTYSDGSPRDDDARGAYLERDLFTGVTLVMDWGYLDIASTYLVVDTSLCEVSGQPLSPESGEVDKDAPSYDRGNATFLADCGALFDELDAELADFEFSPRENSTDSRSAAGGSNDVLDANVIEYDESNSTDDADVWDIHGVTPF